jgi:hypothetical protein
VSEPTERFTVEAVVAEAGRRTGGLDDFGAGPFLEPMQRLVDSLNDEARLNAVGRVIASERLLLHAVNRLHYVDDRRRFPEIAQERIVKPVFIIGFPRTGTTILHDILAQDPDNRAPLTWETMFPSPPPDASTFDSDPRIAQCAALLPNVDTETERDRKFRAMHPMGATLSQECVVMMGEAMCTPLFHNQFRVPSYDGAAQVHAMDASGDLRGTGARGRAIHRRPRLVSHHARGLRISEDVHRPARAAHADVAGDGAAVRPGRTLELDEYVADAESGPVERAAE